MAEPSTTTTVPSTTTMAPLQAKDVMTVGTGMDTSDALGYKHVYLEQSGNLASFTRLINMMLDNHIYFINMQNPPTPAGADPSVTQDVFGLRSPETGTLMDLRNENNLLSLAKGLAFQEMETQWENLTQTDRDRFMSTANAEAKNNRYVYQTAASASDDPDWLTEPGGATLVTSSFDGTPHGDISTIQEALLGMDLHKSSIDNHMPMLANMSPDMFRSIQSELMLLGFYDDAMAQDPNWNPTWGIALQADKNAWWSFINDMVQTNLDQGDVHRTMGKLPSNFEAMQFADFVDKKFFDRVDRWKQNLLTPTIEYDENNKRIDPAQNTYDDLKNAVFNSIKGKVNPDAQTKVEQAIDQTLSTLIADGELDVSKALNQNILGFVMSDKDLAEADAFLHEYFGDDIKLGVTGGVRENKRYRKALGLRTPDEAYNPMYGAPDPDLHDAARLAFHMINQNAGQGDLFKTANIFANTFGAKRFTELNNDSKILDGMVAKLDAMPFHPAYQSSLADANAERLEALDTMEKRALAALDISEFKDPNDQRQRVLIDALNNLGGKGFSGSIYK
jgi:hypothetical protein